MPISRSLSGSDVLLDRFRSTFSARPDLGLYRFLPDGEDELQIMTSGDLDRRARALAVVMLQSTLPGARAIIVAPPGNDYVVAFFACLYAGIVAVPVYPPNPALLKRSLPRLVGVVADADASLVLTNSSYMDVRDQAWEFAPVLSAIPWLAVDQVDIEAGGSWRNPGIPVDSVAFLQYTSGSTGTPKGVMVTHGNLLHNIENSADRIWGDMAPEDIHEVSWLPPYHDMGLIAGLLHPALGGFPVTYMSPLSFVKRPRRWLRAISEHGGTWSGGPNFAYDLCVDKISVAEREGLDLSRWEAAFSGAEPVRVETMDRFARAFEPYGFDRHSFFPCYGMAEATLFVSGPDFRVDRLDERPVRQLQPDALADGSALSASQGGTRGVTVGCGHSLGDQRVLVVDPTTTVVLPDGRIGEIWVSGPGVAAGYWQNPEETAHAFGGRLADTGEGPFLRTGDLGCLEAGELFVTGRIKDLIIVAGRNHYPQDIEQTVRDCHPSIVPGGGVACALEEGERERLLIVQEVTGRPAEELAAEIEAKIRVAVATEHEVVVDDIVLIPRGAIPKTTSGKLRRSECRRQFVEGELKVLFCSSRPVPPAEVREAAVLPVAVPPVAVPPLAVPSVAVPAEGYVAKEAPSPGGRAIRAWLTAALAHRSQLNPAQLDPRQPITSFGLASVDLVGVVGDLELWLGRDLPVTAMWEYPTIDALSEYLVSLTDAPHAPDALPSQDESGSRSGGEPEPVAIVGIGCRFPGGVTDPESFWALLRDEVDGITEVPADRWDVDAFYDPDPAVPGKSTTRWGGFVEHVKEFDTQFFGIAPREAERMDPQQRLLAEVSWEALEDAGVLDQRLAGSSTGVFVGIATSDFAQSHMTDLAVIDAYTGTGSAPSIAANRLSYLLDLRGPSLAVDTACSSSLVAVQLACQAVSRGDCSMAIAGGVNVILSPALSINFSKAGAMASDGRCKAFDAEADGYVRSEGAGMVVLKPLSRALADGDRIYATILGGAVNQDGRTNGLMAPNPASQEAVLRAAYANAGVPAGKVGYVESHGTGTFLGDPIEAKALAAVLSTDREPGSPCLLGSVKSNIGHAEAAAGVAGLIKAALAVQHREVPANLHFTTPNPHIPFDEFGLEVPRAARAWPVDGPALAGVSAFGFGGTNAHVVLQEAPMQVAPRLELTGGIASGQDATVLTISAQSASALRDLASRYADRLAEASDEQVAAVCVAAATRRLHHEHRLACVGTSAQDLRDGLAAFVTGEDHPALVTGISRPGWEPRTVFAFAGQGPRWWPLPEDLLREPVFHAAIERCDQALRGLVGWSVSAELAADADHARFEDAAVGQPALCAVQIALSALWRSWGVEPQAVVGHSVGEIAAAHVAGALNLREAMTVALRRGQVINAALGTGKMVVAAMTADRAEALVAEHAAGRAWVSAFNGPLSTVFSGHPDAVASLVAALQQEGTFCQVLASVDYASHCPLMEPLLGELDDALADLEQRPLTLPMFSTSAGRLLADGEMLEAGYWARNLREPVRFDQAIEGLVGLGHDAFVEMSAGQMLIQEIGERLPQDRPAVAVASLLKQQAGRVSLLANAGSLHCAGHPVDWSQVFPESPMVRLPGYPWQRHKCWVEPPTGRRRVSSAHPLLDTVVHAATGAGDTLWSARVDAESSPYLADHKVSGAAVLPASLILDAALAAARVALGREDVTLEDVRLTRMTMLSETADEDNVQLALLTETAASGSVRFYGSSGGATAWSQAMDGRFRAVDADFGSDPDLAPGARLDLARERCREEVDVEAVYARLDIAGLGYGPSFRGVDALWSGPSQAVGRLHTLGQLSLDPDNHIVHPALLDASLHVLAAALSPQSTDEPLTYLPVSIGQFIVHGAHITPCWAIATVDPSAMSEASDGSIVHGAGVTLFSGDGTEVARLSDITLSALERPASRDVVAESLLELGWRDQGEVLPTLAEASAGDWWLLLADDEGVTDAVAAHLQERGVHAVTVRPGTAYACEAGLATIDPTDDRHTTALLRDLTALNGGPCAVVVHAWALDAGTPEAVVPTPGRDIACVSALHLVQQIVAAGSLLAPRTVFLTRGAQQVGDPAQPVAVGQSGLWGLVRTLGNEHAELHPLIIDLDPGSATNEASLIVSLALSGADGDQVALRDSHRFAPRLEAWRPPVDTRADWARRSWRDDDESFRVLATQRGSLSSLTPTLVDRVPPGPDQVEVRVEAAGLNFSDVLKAMDAYPGLSEGATPLGGEFAGRVVCVGSEVTRARVGDRVFGIGPASMAAYVTTTESLVAPTADLLGDDQAAGLPIAFLTARHALLGLARLRRGESVLVHSATGGVGMAALQVARHVGAQVYATAGSPEKRDLLRSWGIEHVMDSRCLDFADEVRAATGGRGIDVVLNSLSGEALLRSLALLAPGGRFLEIGKQDIYANSRVGLELLKENRSIYAVDMERLIAESPAVVGDLLDDLCAALASGEVEPLPTKTFAFADAGEAFSYMARARHTGKIVLRPGFVEQVAVQPDSPVVRSSRTYLVTGGMGGLGLRTARYLVEHGARHLVLVGRSEPSSAGAAQVDELRTHADVRVLTCDVSLAQDVDQLISTVARTMPPLAGVFHAAGTLDDALLMHQNPERFAAVAAPKATGAWNLHQATLGCELDLFVLYSSAAGLLGSPGQSNYAAANAVLDALALHRRAIGLPALSIDWGPWSEIGLVAHAGGHDAMSEVGVRRLSPDEGIDALDRLIRARASHVAVLPCDREALRRACGQGMVPPLLAQLAGTEETPTTSGPRVEISQRMLAVEPGRRRRAIIVAHCIGEVAHVLRMDESDVDVAAPFAGMGFDSLMSLELRKRLEASLGIELPATVVWRFPTIEQLAPHLSTCMGIELVASDDQPAGSLSATALAGVPATTDGPGTITAEGLGHDVPDNLDDLDDLDNLSADELEQRLLAKVTQIYERGLV